MTIPLKYLRGTLTLATIVCFVVAGGLLLRQAVTAAQAKSPTPEQPWTTKAIEEIAVGDMVLARDEHGTAVGWKPVKEVYRRTSYHLRHLTFRDTAGNEQTFETTDEHPFWSVTAKAFVNAGDLQTGDQVTNATRSADDTTQHQSTASPPTSLQTLTASHRTDHPEGVAVYNFQVDEFHTYYVAARGATGPPVLVHNASSNYDDFDDVVDNLKSTDALRAHNNAVRSLSQQYGLTKGQQRQLHDEITGMNYTRQEIEEIIQSLFGG